MSPTIKSNEDFFEVVVAAQDKGALGEAAMIAEGNFAKVVNPNVFTDPAVISDHQIPRILDSNTRLDDQIYAQFWLRKIEEWTVS